jgi:hypothetical protein
MNGKNSIQVSSTGIHDAIKQDLIAQAMLTDKGIPPVVFYPNKKQPRNACILICRCLEE